MVIRIDVHLAREELNQHVVRLASRVSHMTIVYEIPTKSKLGHCSRMKSWPPAIVWPSRHHGLPHSPSNRSPRSREVRFDKIVTRLLGLSGPINLICDQYKSKLVQRVQNDAVLN
jgi:hypothetical protein